jgi:hypothetical protein
MGNQTLYDTITCAMLFYLALCLCLIGRPSLAVTLLRSIRNARPYLSSSKVMSRLNEAGPRTKMRDSI